MGTIDLQPLKKDGSSEGILPNVAPHAPSRAPSKHNENLNPPSEISDDQESGKSRVEVQILNSCRRPGSSASLNSDGAAGTSCGPALSPSSSMGSLSSEKSTLNPRSKVFFFAGLGQPAKKLEDRLITRMTANIIHFYVLVVSCQLISLALLLYFAYYCE